MAMLLTLARARGEVVPRSVLVDAIWGDDIVTDNALDVCASALRRSLAAATDRAVIEVVRGQGYALRVTDAAN